MFWGVFVSSMLGTGESVNGALNNKWRSAMQKVKLQGQKLLEQQNPMRPETRVHYSKLEYTGVHWSTQEYAGVHGSKLEYTTVH